MGIWYASREDVKRALDVAETARTNGQVDRAIDSASRSVEGMLRRTFAPQTATRFFDWPNRQYARHFRLWLDADEIISVDTLTVAGEVITSSDFFLEPANTGPPFTHLEIDMSSAAAFSAGDTHQRSIEIEGVFGYNAETEPAGALAEELDASETGVDVTDSAAVGVGDILLIDDERMIVTGKSMLDTGQNIGGDLDDQKNDVTVPVSDGTEYPVDETILIDSERMLVVDVAGNNLTVKRAFDGSVLATHSTGADIFAPRTLTVTRGALGTTAATHDDETAVDRHAVPGLVRELTIAEAINTIAQEQSAYGRTIGTGENAREASGRGLRDIRAEAKQRYGRRSRTGAV